MYIDGKWVAAKSGATLDVFNPASGEKIGKAADGDDRDTRAAIEAAEGALSGWSALTAHKRSAYLYRAYDLMVAQKEKLATRMTEEQGKP